MARADDLDVEDNWHGGFYELGLELGPRDDARLEAAMIGLWKAAGVSGCYAVEYKPFRHVSVDLSLAALQAHGHLRGTVRLPSGKAAVCGIVAIRFDDGDDWVELYLPLGALARTDERVGPFPFGDPSGLESLAWRLPLDRWLADVAAKVYDRVPFGLGLIGFEATGEIDPGSLVAGLPEDRSFGFVVPEADGVRYTEANR